MTVLELAVERPQDYHVQDGDDARCTRAHLVKRMPMQTVADCTLQVAQGWNLRAARNRLLCGLDLPYNDQSNLTCAQCAPERQAGAVWHHPRQGFRRRRLGSSMPIRRDS